MKLMYTPGVIAGRSDRKRLRTQEMFETSSDTSDQSASRLITNGELRSPKAVSAAPTRMTAPPRYASSIWVMGEGMLERDCTMRSMVLSSSVLQYPDFV